MSKISLVIPIGRFSYFVHACLRNIFETCGSPESLDVVFLTSKTINPEIRAAFITERKFFPFRVISAPFEAWPNHQLLLDWAVREADLTDWVIFQHCDLFWTQRNWLPHILNSIDPNLTVLYHPGQSFFFFDNKEIPLVGDFFGVYNRQQLVQKNLYFKWGTLNTDMVSREVLDAIQAGLITPVPEIGLTFMDGSQAMSWELTVKYPRDIRPINNLHFIHLTAFFRIADKVSWRNNCFICRDYIPWLSNFSYLTSFCIEKHEVANIALPWSIFVPFAHKNQHHYFVRRSSIIGRWLQQYSKAKHVVGMDNLGLTKVVYYNQLLRLL